MQQVLFSKLNKLTTKLTWLPPLLTRLSLGSLFLETGWGKLNNLPKVTGFFTELGIPMPSFMAHLVATTEFSCGALLIAGFLTRLASIPLIITMIVAMLTAKLGGLESITDLPRMTEYLYIVLLIWLVITGAGFLSLDRLFWRHLKK